MSEFKKAILVVVALIIINVIALVDFAHLGVTRALFGLCHPGFSYVKFSTSICI